MRTNEHCWGVIQIVCLRSLHLVRGIGCSWAVFRMGGDLSFWPQPTLSLERTALVWSHVFPFQPEFLQTRNGNQNPFLTKNLEIPQSHSSSVPPSISPGRHKIPLYHSYFSLFKTRWILMLYLAYSCANSFPSSLRPSFSHVPGLFFLLGVPQMFSSSLGKLCPWHAAQAHQEQSLSQDWVQVKRHLGSQSGDGHSQNAYLPGRKCREVCESARCCCC